MFKVNNENTRTTSVTLTLTLNIFCTIFQYFYCLTIAFYYLIVSLNVSWDIGPLPNNFHEKAKDIQNTNTSLIKISTKWDQKQVKRFPFKYRVHVRQINFRPFFGLLFKRNLSCLSKRFFSVIFIITLFYAVFSSRPNNKDGCIWNITEFNLLFDPTKLLK